MTKERSPRFPFIPLRAALAQLTKIDDASGDKPLTRPEAMKALGFEKPNGRSNRLFAAMRGYGLLEAPDSEKPAFVVSKLGKRLLKSPQARANGPWLAAAREAVLHPPMFRRLWRNLRDLDREQLVTALMQRDFTEQGAETAAAVFFRNREIAGLDDMPAGLEPPMPAAAKKAAAKRGRLGGPCNPNAAGAGAPAGNRPMGPPRDAVILPLANKRAIIPTGISQADYDLLLETLKLWKDKIVKN